MAVIFIGGGTTKTPKITFYLSVMNVRFYDTSSERMCNCSLPPSEFIFSYIMMRTSYVPITFVRDKHAYLDFYSVISLKQQSAGRHVAPLGHIILITSEPVFANML